MELPPCTKADGVQAVAAVSKAHANSVSASVDAKAESAHAPESKATANESSLKTDDDTKLVDIKVKRSSFADVKFDEKYTYDAETDTVTGHRTAMKCDIRGSRYLCINCDYGTSNGLEFKVRSTSTYSRVSVRTAVYQYVNLYRVSVKKGNA